MTSGAQSKYDKKPSISKNGCKKPDIAPDQIRSELLTNPSQPRMLNQKLN